MILRKSRPALVLILVVTMLATMFAIPGFVPDTYAADSRNTTYKNAQGGTSWSFGKNLAGNDITTTKEKTRTNTVTVIFNDEERALANEGFLSYTASAHFGANGSRSADTELSVTCYDAAGQKLTAGSFTKTESGYSVSHHSRNHSSGTVTIPAGVAQVKYYAYVSIDTKGDLELENMEFTIHSSMTSGGYETITDPSEIKDKQMYEYYDENNKGSGYVTTYYDLFKGSTHRLDLNDQDALFKAAQTNHHNLNRWIQLANHTYKNNNTSI